jgi:UPF0716 protein FxsA
MIRNPLPTLIFLFVTVPLVELVVLLIFAHYTHWLTTLILILATGVVGATLAKSQGEHVWREFHRRLQRGEVPADTILHGFMILAAGLLLLTPGILTDIVGFALLVPLFRRMLIRRGVKKFEVYRTTLRSGTSFRRSPESPTGETSPNDQEPIDVEFEETDD